MKQSLGAIYRSLSAALESSPAVDVTPKVAKQLSQAQGSEGGKSKGELLPNSPLFCESPRPLVSPRERSVSPHRPLKRARGEGEDTPSSPVRRQGKETSPSPIESPHQAGVSPQEGRGGAPGLGKNQVNLAETPCPVPKSPAGRKRWFSESFGFKKPSVKMFRSAERGGTSVSESGKSPE